MNSQLVLYLFPVPSLFHVYFVTIIYDLIKSLSGDGDHSGEESAGQGHSAHSQGGFREANHIRSHSILSFYLSSEGILQSPWHPPRCWSYDCRPGICSGSVEVVVDMRLVSQKLMKRIKVSRKNKTIRPNLT